MESPAGEVREIGLAGDWGLEVEVLDDVPDWGAIPLSLWVNAPATPYPATPEPPPFTISGIITHHGKPLPDAVVGFPNVGGCFYDEPDDRYERPHERRTRADGSFTLDIVVHKPMLFDLEISEASGLHAFRTVELLPAGHVDLTIEVADIGSISGTVTADGPRRSQLRVNAGLSGVEPYRSRAVYVRVADDGRFSIPRLETDRWYDLTVEDRDTGRSVTRAVYLDAARPDLSDLVVDLADHDRPR